MSVSPPSVSILLVNYNGARHLPACLESLAALDYATDRYEVLLVDNGSTDRSRALLNERYPWVRVLPQGENLGFAEGNNVGAAASDADCLALLNTDMKVEPDWLSRLVEQYDPAERVACVGALILDWEGKHVDFADGIVNHYGFGDQPGLGRPLEDVDVRDGRELPFACAGSMLIDRKLFLAVGGFDPRFFAYFEDVDLGWRIWLAGHRVRLAAGARVYHRHHGTSGSLPDYQRTLLYERNALRTLIKNLEERNLGPVLSGALLLLLERARLATGSDRSEFQLGVQTRRTSEMVDRHALAPLHAVSDLVGELDELMEERRRVQALRRVPDAEIFARFGHPFRPLGRADDAYLEAMTRVTQALRFDELFTTRKASRVLVLAYDRIGERMAGPGVRSWEIARALARSVPVTLASDEEIGRRAPGIENVRFANEEALRLLVEEADIVLLHGHAVERWSSLRTARALKVVDLYDPWLLENLENQRSFSPLQGDWIARRDVDVQRELLDIGDFFVCASERQRDYWLGMLSARGRLDRATYEADPTLRSLIDVLPYGCPQDPPERGRALRGVHPKVPEDAFLLLWGGGTWDWFDPLSVLEAFAKLHRQLPHARLYFMGLELSDRGVPPQRVARDLRSRAEQLGLAGESVLFGDWVAYDDRGAYLAEADVGVLATRPLAEVRLAFRSRLLDHFWAGLPTVTTGGDTLAELVEREQAGIVCAPGDVDALTDALLTLARDFELRSRIAANAARLADRYRWHDVIQPIRQVAEEPWRWEAARAHRATPISLTEDAQLLLQRRRQSAAAPALTAAIEAVVAPMRASSLKKTARKVWRHTPEGVRVRVRPLLRRLQNRPV